MMLALFAVTALVASVALAANALRTQMRALAMMEDRLVSTRGALALLRECEDRAGLHSATGRFGGLDAAAQRAPVRHGQHRQQTAQSNDPPEKQRRDHATRVRQLQRVVTTVVEPKGWRDPDVWASTSADTHRVTLPNVHGLCLREVWHELPGVGRVDLLTVRAVRSNSPPLDATGEEGVWMQAIVLRVTPRANSPENAQNRHLRRIREIAEPWRR